MLISNLFTRYKTLIQTLPVNAELTKEQLLTDDFLLQRDDNIEMFYAPHNEYVNTHAKVCIIGITPGWTQMELAFRTARMYLEQGLSDDEVCKKVKLAARFAGSMRNNMIDMFKVLELHNYLQLSNAEELFSEQHQLLHTTSMLRYPVFVSKRNYTGHNPPLLSVPLLREFAIQSVSSEIRQLHRPLIIPLGRTVEAVLRLLANDCLIDPAQCLWGFPHPSGANGHRHKQFAQGFAGMQQTIVQYDWQ